MKRSGTIVIIAVLAFLLIGFGSSIAIYNSIVTAEEKMDNTYADIDT